VHAYDALWLRPDCVVLNDGGYPWKRDEGKEESEDETMLMSTSAVRMKLGAMSGGDLKTMKALLDSLGIPYAEDGGYLITEAVSTGDQPPILAKAAGLGIGFVPYVPADDVDTDKWVSRIDYDAMYKEAEEQTAKANAVLEKLEKVAAYASQSAAALRAGK
jgi:hypothetical protein